VLSSSVIKVVCYAENKYMKCNEIKLTSQLQSYEKSVGTEQFT